MDTEDAPQEPQKWDGIYDMTDGLRDLPAYLRLTRAAERFLQEHPNVRYAIEEVAKARRQLAACGHFSE